MGQTPSGTPRISLFTFTADGMSKYKSKGNRKKGEVKREQISQEVHRWATEVMKYKEAPNPEDLKLYVGLVKDGFSVLN